MAPAHIILVILFSVGMGFGQLILKFAATKASLTQDQDLWSRLFSLATNWAFLTGATLYALMLVYWIWLLTFLPLSRAYPFTLVSIAVALVGSHYLFNEVITINNVAGIAIIGVGLVVLSLA